MTSDRERRPFRIPRPASTGFPAQQAPRKPSELLAGHLPPAGPSPLTRRQEPVEEEDEEELTAVMPSLTDELRRMTSSHPPAVSPPEVLLSDRFEAPSADSGSNAPEFQAFDELDVERESEPVLPLMARIPPAQPYGEPATGPRETWGHAQGEGSLRPTASVVQFADFAPTRRGITFVLVAALVGLFALVWLFRLGPDGNEALSGHAGVAPGMSQTTAKPSAEAQPRTEAQPSGLGSSTTTKGGRLAPPEASSGQESRRSKTIHEPPRQ